MTLHIALEGIDGVGKSTQVDRLLDFFKNKEYCVRKAVQPVNEEVIHILKNYQLLPQYLKIIIDYLSYPLLIFLFAVLVYNF